MPPLSSGLTHLADAQSQFGLDHVEQTGLSHTGGTDQRRYPAPQAGMQFLHAHLLQRATRRDPRVAFVEACTMLLENNAGICARCFPEPRGKLAPGQLADVAIFDYVPTTPLEDGRFLGHLLYGLNYARVHTTIARGNVLMRDSRILTLDEPAICAKAREAARGVWKRF